MTALKVGQMWLHSGGYRYYIVGQDGDTYRVASIYNDIYQGMTVWDLDDHDPTNGMTLASYYSPKDGLVVSLLSRVGDMERTLEAERDRATINMNDAIRRFGRQVQEWADNHGINQMQKAELKRDVLDPWGIPDRPVRVRRRKIVPEYVTTRSSTHITIPSSWTEANLSW